MTGQCLGCREKPEQVVSLFFNEAEPAKPPRISLFRFLCHQGEDLVCPYARIHGFRIGIQAFVFQIVLGPNDNERCYSRALNFCRTLVIAAYEFSFGLACDSASNSGFKSKMTSRRRGSRRRRRTVSTLRSRRRANEDAALIWNWNKLIIQAIYGSAIR